MPVPGLDPGIVGGHPCLSDGTSTSKTWMAGTSPAMTPEKWLFVRRHRYIHPAGDVLDRARRTRHDIEIENVGRQPQGRAGIGNIDDAGDMPLHWRRAEDGISLRLRVAELGEVLDRVEAGLAIGDVDIEIVLLAPFVDRDALEDQIVVVGRRDRRRLEDRVLDAVFRHPVLDDVDLEVEPAGHLDGAAEGDLAVALTEMQVPHGKAG